MAILRNESAETHVTAHDFTHSFATQLLIKLSAASDRVLEQV